MIPPNPPFDELGPRARSPESGSADSSESGSWTSSRHWHPGTPKSSTESNSTRRAACHSPPGFGVPRIPSNPTDFRPDLRRVASILPMTNSAPDASEDPKLTERIAQFENMTTADPENEMAHFSLGNAYMKAGRHAEAAGSLEKVTELNPDMSKAFQLAGESMIQAGWEDKAVGVLERGYEIAASKGDLMVRDAIGTALEGIGRTVPALSSEIEEAANRSAEGGSFVCRRTGKNGTAIEHAPFKGPRRRMDQGQHLQRDLE